MSRIGFRFAALTGLLLSFIVTAGATAQEPVAERLRIYLQCGACDFDYVRREITWVDYVRDRLDSDVHVLVTTQGTGAGGREYSMEFIGRGRFEAHSDTLVYRSTRDDTSDLIRQGLTQVLKMGLMPYLVGTPAERQLNISLMPAGQPGRPAAVAPQESTRDPWNYWVFSMSANGFLNGESQQEFANYGLSFSANRTTELWKFSSGLSRSYSESSFEVDPETTIKSIRKSYGASVLLVRSLGANFSAGVRGQLNSSTFGNLELGLSVAPALEYDLFPYAESSRRIFTLRYSAGVNSYDYREITVFDETKETRPSHTFEADYRLTQPWGSLRLGVDLSQFLHDTNKWRGSMSASTSLRLVRGLSLSIGGTYSRVRDQLTLAKGEATRDEVLLRLKQLQTNYFYYFNFGLSYRFGSSLNNVVNPRMGGMGGVSGGEGIVIMM